MDEKLMHSMVQKSIGYVFKNIDLLDQAFTRKSYSEEYGGENNEILEFIGDKSLDIAVVRFLAENYGRFKKKQTSNQLYFQGLTETTKGEYACNKTEGWLTQLKSQMVCKKTLARRIDELGYAKFLKVGSGDKKNRIWNEPSVKEDLFEAIIGAVTLDCNWDISAIQSVVEAMLMPEEFIIDSDDNYIREIYEWEEKNGVLPWFWFADKRQPVPVYVEYGKVIHQSYMGFYNYTCELKLTDDLPLFRGYGMNKSEARMNVCKLAYDYLDKNDLLYDIRDEIDNPCRAQAINQLEILASRGYFKKPEYEFEQSYDEDGNPIWECSCSIDGEEYYFTESASKKTEAKKSAAYEMLKYVLDLED